MIDRTITDKMIGETIIDRTIEGTTKIDKIMEQMTPNRGIGIGVRVEKDQEITIVSNSSRRDGHTQQRTRRLSDDRDRSRPRSRSNSRVSSNRDQIKIVIDVVSMIILHKNAQIPLLMMKWDTVTWDKHLYRC